MACPGHLLLPRREQDGPMELVNLAEAASEPHAELPLLLRGGARSPERCCHRCCGGEPWLEGRRVARMKIALRTSAVSGSSFSGAPPASLHGQRSASMQLSPDL